ncbi:MAG: sodium/proton-translocating pyrophosphatase [Ruminococcaceae bacterium]|nr:sodium/proton-translocating pyrophosphatase [Oscillospiraceae bacterium]
MHILPLLVSSHISFKEGFLSGTVLSAIAGKLGFIVAALSNGRSAEAATKGIQPAFLVGFRGGSVMGLIVVGSAVLGVSAVLMVVGFSIFA